MSARFARLDDGRRSVRSMVEQPAQQAPITAATAAQRMVIGQGWREIFVKGLLW